MLHVLYSCRSLLLIPASSYSRPFLKVPVSSWPHLCALSCLRQRDSGFDLKNGQDHNCADNFYFWHVLFNLNAFKVDIGFNRQFGHQDRLWARTNNNNFLLICFLTKTASSTSLFRGEKTQNMQTIPANHHGNLFYIYLNAITV